MNHTTLTLGELLTNTDETIKRNTMSILKRLQNCPHEEWDADDYEAHKYRKCIVCGIKKHVDMF